MDKDIIIVGAGPAGGVLALLAAQSGFSVALIDGRDPAAPQPADIRNYAVVLGSWRLLQGIGLGGALEPLSEPLHGLEAEDGARHWISGTPAALFSDADLRAGEGETLGRMIPACHLGEVIDAAVRAQDGVVLLAPARFVALEQQAGSISVTLEGGRKITGALLVGADGTQSEVRRAAGIGTISWPYDLSVLAVDVQLSRPHGGIARQLFTAEGPFAVLPLRGDRANLAWYMPRAAARALSAMPAPAIEAELNARFEAFAGHMTLDGPHLSYPLELRLAESMQAPRVALVGDAVRRLSPIAGQGLNSGLKDVAALVELMEEQRRIGLDVGASSMLERYERWRRADSLMVAMAMDAMTRGFSGRSLLTRPVKALALGLADRFGPLRRALVAQASATQRSLPRRMQNTGL